MTNAINHIATESGNRWTFSDSGLGTLSARESTSDAIKEASGQSKFRTLEGPLVMNLVSRFRKDELRELMKQENYANGCSILLFTDIGIYTHDDTHWKMKAGDIYEVSAG